MFLVTSIIKQLIAEYKPETASDVSDMLKDMFSDTLEAMLLCFRVRKPFVAEDYPQLELCARPLISYYTHNQKHLAKLTKSTFKITSIVL